MIRVTYPTHRASSAFLQVMWAQRSDLTDLERQGFAHYVYLTVCGTVEAALALAIKNRLRSIDSLSYKSAPVTVEQESKKYRMTNQPVLDSLSNLIRNFRRSVEAMPLGRLIELYSQMFSDTLPQVLGKELYDEVQGLAALRNLFAHGRELYFDFKGQFSDVANTQVDLDRNPLKGPLSRLAAAGIIKTTKASGANYTDMMDVFYTDAALLHFYCAAKDVLERLKAANDYLPERLGPHGQFPELVPLDA